MNNTSELIRQLKAAIRNGLSSRATDALKIGQPAAAPLQLHRQLKTLRLRGMEFAKPETVVPGYYVESDDPDDGAAPAQPPQPD